MTPSTFDTCPLFNDNMTAIVGLQTDDSLIAGTIEFMDVESRELHAAGLVAKPCERLTPEQPLEFNGFVITLGEHKNQPTQTSEEDPIAFEVVH